MSNVEVESLHPRMSFVQWNVWVVVTGVEDIDISGNNVSMVNASIVDNVTI